MSIVTFEMCHVLFLQGKHISIYNLTNFNDVHVLLLIISVIVPRLEAEVIFYCDEKRSFKDNIYVVELAVLVNSFVCKDVCNILSILQQEFFKLI